MPSAGLGEVRAAWDAGCLLLVPETREKGRSGDVLARVPGDERGLQQLERQQMGTFSAGAAPPLPQPGSLSP